ncbi:hypothetical protein JX266_008980 [Neoarthrinium moseri]|nr:hypothetical protein JX266_008980 [Neoarthrinium moseri]
MDHNYLNEMEVSQTLRIDVPDEVKYNEEVGGNAYEKLYRETNKAFEEWLISGPGPHILTYWPVEVGTPHRLDYEGVHRYRFLIGDKHGYERESCEPWAYEHAKYNQRLNPAVRRVANFGTDEPDFVPSEMDLKAATLAMFPHVGGVVTRASFCRSNMPLTHEQADQPDHFSTVMKLPELSAIIVENLVTWRESLSNFSRTCQFVFGVIDGSFGRWKSNRLDFGNCDKSAADTTDLIAKGKMTWNDVADIRIPRTLIVGPVRYNLDLADGFKGDPTVFFPPKVWLKGTRKSERDYRKLFNEHGFRETVGYQYKRGGRDYKREMEALKRTIKSFHLHAHRINNLTLERMPFLDRKTVEACLDKLACLKNFCLYSCELIDFGEVLPIVKKVGAINAARSDKQNKLGPLDLDISPPLRQGPIGQRYGSYGVTHSDPKIFNKWGTDTGRALAAALVPLERASRQAGITLFTPGKAFRLWLDKLPLEPFQAECLCIAVAKFVEHDINGWSVAEKTFPHKADEKLVEEMHQTMGLSAKLDLVAAATAKPVVRKDFFREGNLPCQTCGETLPGALFRAEVHIRHRSQYKCEGCELICQLGLEGENHKFKMRQIARWIWRDARDPDIDWLFTTPEAARNWKKAEYGVRTQLDPKVTITEIQQKEDELESLRRERLEFDDYRDRKDLDVKIAEVEKRIADLKVLIGEQYQPITCRATEYDWDYRRKQYAFRAKLDRGEFTINGPHNIQRRETYEQAFLMNW